MFLLVVSLLGCTPPQPAYFEGMLLDDITFVYASDAHGIYPNTGVLTDESNPFANRPLWAGKWDVESYGYPPASYYAWATQLAVEATGENQYYTATALSNLYLFQMVDAYEAPLVWNMAVEAHRSVLTNFPHSVSYLADGVTNFPLAPLSYDALVLLGDDVSDWTKVTGDDGTVLIFSTGEQ